jgi:hypothetical protein
MLFHMKMEIAPASKISQTSFQISKLEIGFGLEIYPY